ncbi:MAG: hypothetical protein CMJ47_08790 [Planctomyces sp.]|nr:hypothetical protein [Planctomyces sp.]
MATRKEAFAARDAISALCHQCCVSADDLSCAFEELSYCEEKKSWLDRGHFRKRADAEVKKLTDSYSSVTAAFVHKQGLHNALAEARADERLPALAELPLKVSAATNADAACDLAVKLASFARRTLRNLRNWLAMTADGREAQVSDEFRQCKDLFRTFRSIEWGELQELVEVEFDESLRYCDQSPDVERETARPETKSETPEKKQKKSNSRKSDFGVEGAGVLRVWLKMIKDDHKTPRNAAIQEYLKDHPEASESGLGKRFQHNRGCWEQAVSEAREKSKRKLTGN